MNTYPVILASIIHLCSVYASCSAPEGEQADPAKKAEEARPKDGIAATKIDFVTEPWLAKLHGKSLSSMGQIIVIRIQRKDKGEEWVHRDLWNILEQSVLKDYASVGIALGIPPEFTIEYADGTKASCDRYSALITLPDGRSGHVALIQKAEHVVAPNGP